MEIHFESSDRCVCVHIPDVGKQKPEFIVSFSPSLVSGLDVRLTCADLLISELGSAEVSAFVTGDVRFRARSGIAGLNGPLPSRKKGGARSLKFFPNMALGGCQSFRPNQPPQETCCWMIK